MQLLKKSSIRRNWLKLTVKELNDLPEFKNGHTCWYNINGIDFNKPGLLRFIETRKK